MVDSGVLRIVSSNNVEIFKHLGAAHLRRAGTRQVFGSDVDDLRTLIIAEKPTLVILDAALPSGSGYELCREIKDNPATKSTHVIILEGSVLAKEHVDKIGASGCDDVLALPLHADDFYFHLAQITGISLRAGHRIAVTMSVTLERGGKSWSGRAVNVSNSGLGLHFADEVPLGPLAVTLTHLDDHCDDIQGEIVWCHPSEDGYALGLHFLAVPPAAQFLLAKLSLFQVTSLYEITQNASGDGITVILQGGFDEQSDFAPLYAKICSARYIDFMMQHVTYLSSSGVRAWCLFLEKLTNIKATYSFRHCSLAFASQAAMIPMVIGGGKVLSMQTPYFCQTCDREETRLIEAALVRQVDGTMHAPPLHCHICNNPLTFDDLPARYFAFLGD